MEPSEQDQGTINLDDTEELIKPKETDSGMVSVQENSNLAENPENANQMPISQDTNKDNTPNDSGMASLQDSSKDVTPEKPNKPIVNEESDDEDIEDETIGERLWGLTEMFPESLVNGTCFVVSGTKSGIKGIYNLSRSTLWIFFSTAAVLIAPLIVEVERAQMIESQRNNEKQILLGSNTVSSHLAPNMPLMPIR